MILVIEVTESSYNFLSVFPNQWNEDLPPSQFVDMVQQGPIIVC